MANLISDIMSMATPTVVNKIASSFGMDTSAVTGVLGGAVPGIMAALANHGSTPSGAKDIMSKLSGINTDVGSALTSNPSGLATQGSSMLSSLLGQGGLSTLTNAISSHAGIPAAAGASLMGVAAQMVMGSLAKSSAGLDSSGLSSLLASQSGFIKQALPSSLASVVGMPSAVAGAVRNAAGQMASTAPAASGMVWLKYVIPLVLIALAIWYFVGHRSIDDVAVVKPATTTDTAPAVPAAPASIVVDNIDVGKSLTTALGTLGTTLPGITDLASAQAALPKLQDAGAAIAAISGFASRFTPDQKSMVAGLITNGMPGLTSAATTALAIPGVGDVLKPVMDTILSNLGNLAK